MTINGPDTAENASTTSLSKLLRTRIGRATRLAWLALLWERAWPKIAVILAIGAIFVALSWLGLWRSVPDGFRFAGLALFVAALVYSLFRLSQVRIPTEPEALARVEERTGFSHRPVTAVTDRIGSGGADPLSQALWHRHQERAAASLTRISVGVPRPKLYRSDPWALRVGIAMLLIIGFGVAGPDRISRLGDAFSLPAGDTSAGYRIDAWIDPPSYTGRVPIFLTRQTGDNGELPDGLSVPQGSVFIARIQGEGLFSVAYSGDDETIDVPAEAATGDAPVPPNGPREFRWKLAKGGTISVTDNGSERASWAISVIPDAVPTITLAKPPETTTSTALKLTYSVADDYGVVAAEATVAPAPDGVSKQTEPLVAPPRFPLTLPQRGARKGDAATIRDLTAHPWAGSRVLLTLSARDVAGQTGTSKPFEMTLPSRFFAKPLARAVAEQRRILALDRQSRDRVVDALDALMIAPEEFIQSAPVYLGMLFTYKTLIAANSDDDLREVVDLMWTLALSIEDGDVSLAMRELRQAQEALRQALENGASEEEIRRRTEELRAAMERFFNALAEQARRNPQAMMPMDPNARALSQRDMQQMLDRIEQLARSGSRESAQQLLSEMQQMLENLQTGQTQQMPGETAREMSKMLDQLADMIRRQRELMEETHRMDQQRQQGERDGQQNPNGEQNGQQDGDGERKRQLGQLRQGQSDLQQQLEEMMRRMEELGLQPGDQMGQAGEFMGQAGERLGKGQAGRAVESQGDALNALREGADQMIEQMMAQGQGQGRRRGQNAQNDPLGRPQRTDGPDLGGRTKIPGEIDVQRARRILEELRRRLSDPARPRLELDYLERLIPGN